MFELLERKNQIAVLIDPEKNQDEEKLKELVRKINFSGVHFIFVGGSTVTAKDFNSCMEILKRYAKIPILLFPGSSTQVSDLADGILYLSLLSGRNPDFLIDHHVRSAKKVDESGISVLPTSYLLIDGGTNSSVAYVSQTSPIPRDKTSIVYDTALAGKLQGKQIIFLDAGSGANWTVPTSCIQAVGSLEQPIIVGGGIKNVEEIQAKHEAGANVVVIGNKIEEEIDFLLDITSYTKGGVIQHKKSLPSGDRRL